MSNPTQNHLQAAKRILRYIQGTLHYGLAFTFGPFTLFAYSEVDWAGDPVDHKSIIGIVIFFGNCPITQSTKKQATVSRSFTEAEYHALASIAIELCWIRMLLRDLGTFRPQPPLLWCDNVSALAIASNPVFHTQTKHIEVDYHFVCERVLRRDLLVKFFSTHDQLANIFTKSLPSPRFHQLTSKLMWKFSFRLRGDESCSSKLEISNEEDDDTIPIVKSKTVSFVQIVKCKSRLKQNVVVPH